MRYYKPITLQELKDKIEPIFEHFEEEYEFTPAIDKDLAKVRFGMENLTRPDETEGYGDYPFGFRQFNPDFPVFFANAGGDGDFPICFVMYWDGKQVRAYIPKDGNVYNKKQKCAFGEEEDLTDTDWDREEGFFEKCQKEVSTSKIFQDVLSRIVPKI